MDLIDKLKNKINYRLDYYKRENVLNKFTYNNQVKLHNWSYPFPQDLWLINFIEKRELLKGKPNLKIALHSIFGIQRNYKFNKVDVNIFVERENLHKPSMQGWLHRFLDDNRVDLSLGFDYIDHPQYLRYPFWLMWDIFSPTAHYNEIKKQIDWMDSPSNHSYDDRKYCAYLCSHDDIGRRKTFEQFSTIGHIDCDGKLFHNNDELKTIFGDDKLKYLRQYRFNLTPENTNYKDYVTEKLFEAIHAGCVPIYHGSDNNPEPDVLNNNAIIFIKVGEENKEAIETVKYLNSNKKAYLEFANQKRFTKEAPEIIWNYYCGLESKLIEIIHNI